MSGYRIKNRFQTMFIKLTCSFVLLGMVPMLILGGIFINQYAHDAREMAVSSLEQSVQYVAQSVENIFMYMTYWKMNLCRRQKRVFI